MSEERRTRGLWFWGMVAIVAIYFASFIGLIGLPAKLFTPGQTRVLRLFYSPIIWTVKKLVGSQ